MVNLFVAVVTRAAVTILTIFIGLILLELWLT